MVPEACSSKISGTHHIYRYLRATVSILDILKTNDNDLALARLQLRQKKREAPACFRSIARSYGQSALLGVTPHFFPYVVSSICKYGKKDPCNLTGSICISTQLFKKYLN